MKNSNLVLVHVAEGIGEIQPAAMYERDAAKYLKISVNDLRAYVKSGAIKARHHPGRKKRIYLKFDLDAYLEALPKEVVA